MCGLTLLKLTHQNHYIPSKRHCSRNRRFIVDACIVSTKLQKCGMTNKMCLKFLLKTQWPFIVTDFKYLWPYVFDADTRSYSTAINIYRKKTV